MLYRLGGAGKITARQRKRFGDRHPLRYLHRKSGIGAAYVTNETGVGIC
jgi:hypothetical protein